MKELNILLKELGISKVKLARYLGVSRQMVYNYLELDSLNEWPKDKKTKLLLLLGVEEVGERKNVNPTNDYILKIEKKLFDSDKDSMVCKGEILGYNVKSLSKRDQKVLFDIVNLLKDELND